jgi:hypothetical protein
MRKTRLILAGLVVTASLHAYAQSCPAVDSDSRDSQWKIGQEYNVYLNPSDPFLSQCSSALQSALNAWQFSSANTMWGVGFNLTSNATDPSLLRVYYRTPQVGRCAGHSLAGCFSADYETLPMTYGFGMTGGSIELDPHHQSCDSLAQTFAHEIGHGFGLGECTGCGNSSIMGPASTNAMGTIIYNPNLPKGPTSCDETAVRDKTDAQIEWETEQEACGNPQGCPFGQFWDMTTCQCEQNPPHEGDPLILDMRGDGLELTSVAAGVRFDLAGDGVKRQIGWTAVGADDAWLARDRNGNGRIDDGRELFSDTAEQRASGEPNGFLALAMLDEPAYGGNGDDRIDRHDRDFAELLLWLDRNHDGISQSGELTPLANGDVKAIDLDYRSSNRHDRNGNYFRYRAKVSSKKDSDVGRWAYDVFVRIAD